MPKTVIFTRLTAKPGRREELIRTLLPVVEAAQGEPGTEVFATHGSDAASEELLFYEVYRDRAALAAHRENPAVTALLDRLSELLARPPEITYATPLHSKGLGLDS